jgi:esterase/lipase
MDALLVGFKRSAFMALFVCIFSVSGTQVAQAQETSPQANNDSVIKQLLKEKLSKNALASEKLAAFIALYEPELGTVSRCEETNVRDIKLCSSSLRNSGNSPYILLPKQTPKATVVLFHGLSDSPFFMRSIGEFLQTKGYVVIAPLTPGHGKKEADADMQDDQLQDRWVSHTQDVMNFASSFDLPVVIGGFSTGGALASHYTLNNPDSVSALLLFSGALELSGAAEAMSKVWGMKSLAKWLDGEYEADGPHPHKYPSVATYTALVLMDVIKEIRELLDEKSISKPIFAAHSMADNTTLFEGIENLTGAVDGNHTIFKIDESYDLCHADLPMSSVQIVNLDYDKTQINDTELCKVPKANPLHDKMLLMLDIFLTENIALALAS